MLKHFLGKKLGPNKQKTGLDGFRQVNKHKTILHCVHFITPGGGLHEHVLFNAITARKHGINNIIACPEGLFAQRLRTLGFEVFATEFDKGVEFLNFFENIKIDLIHVHPGKSRKLGISLSKRHKLPVVMTIHGRWLNNVQNYIDDLDLLICVSNTVTYEVCKALEEKDNLREQINKIIVVPNTSWMDLSSSAEYVKHENEKINIVCACRYDQDKMPVINFLIEAIRLSTNDIYWHIIGDGEFLPLLKENATTNEDVKFYGWLEQSSLNEIQKCADYAIQPGKAAINSLSLGIPTLCIGSGGIIDALTPVGCLKALTSNFGGIHSYSKVSPESFIKHVNDNKTNNETNILIKQIIQHYCGEEAQTNELELIYQSLLEINGTEQ